MKIQWPWRRRAPAPPEIVYMPLSEAAVRADLAALRGLDETDRTLGAALSALARLHARFGTRVRLVPSVTFANGRRGRGRIEIDFADNDELTRLLELFGVDVND